MHENDIGSFYTTGKHDVWELVSFCPDPTAMLRNLKTGEEIGGVIGCLNLEPFVQLVPKNK